MSFNRHNSSTLRLAALLVCGLSIGGYIGNRLTSAADYDSSSAAGDERKTDEAGARAAFDAAYSVFSHPRCVNCHPSGNAPLQGDDSHPHAFRVQRGADGTGLAAERCGNCHQAANLAGAHMPPGAAFPAEAKEPPTKPRWRLPAAQAPMVFQGRTPGQLCRQLKDPRQNGGLTLEQLIQHVGHDPLVLWGWDPGEGRTRPPITHAEFVEKITEWVNKGAACPEKP